MIYRVGLVGLGNIGMRLDLDVNEIDVIASHSKAVHEHPSFYLGGAADTTVQARDLFKEKYSAPAFASVSELVEAVSPEVLVIATPPETHANIFEAALKFDNVKLVLLEKPLSFSRSDDSRLLDILIGKNTQVLVNFFRRADSSFTKVSALFDRELRPPFRGVCWYSKGIYNSASHFLDLLSAWFGPFKLAETGPLKRRFGPDIDIDFIIENSVATFNFISLDDRNFSHHSVEIFAANGRLTYDLAGDEIHVGYSHRDSIFENYYSLESKPSRISSDLKRGLFWVYDDIWDYLRNGSGSLPTLKESAQTATVLHDISERVNEKP